MKTNTTKNTTKIPKITTPHNNLFVQVLSIKEKAIAFFEKYLPNPIFEIADLEQIELVESKHMSDAGLSLYNDVLYRCPLGKDQVGYFFLMCEHQSKPDPNMPLRLMEYDLATIKLHLKQGHSKFPKFERRLVGRYIALCVDRNRYNLEKIVSLIITNEQEKEVFMRSVAQEYIEQGVQQGVQQGIITKAKAVAKTMLLKLHLDIDTVQKATELSKEELQELLKEVNNTAQ